MSNNEPLSDADVFELGRMIGQLSRALRICSTALLSISDEACTRSIQAMDDPHHYFKVIQRKAAKALQEASEARR